MDILESADFEKQKSWFKDHARVGMVVPVHHTQGGMTSVVLDRIKDISPENGRIYLEKAGAFYMSGKNCWHPTGQTNLRIPSRTMLLTGAFNLVISHFGVSDFGPHGKSPQELCERVFRDYPGEEKNAFENELKRALAER